MKIFRSILAQRDRGTNIHRYTYITNTVAYTIQCFVTLTFILGRDANGHPFIQMEEDAITMY